MKSFVIIAASGVGKRMQLEGGVSKQMLEIGGLPVICHTIRAFEEAATVEAIYIATKAESISQLEEMIARHGFTKVRAVIEGGKERQDSIGNCIALIEAEIRTTGAMPDAILVHDGARPFIQPVEINDIARISANYGACVPATKPKDTIKFIGSSPEVFGETIDRSRLLQVQTPQGFTPEKLIEAHKLARREGLYATDDAALVERFFPEQAIRIYETGYHNIKITTPEDIFLAEAILASLKQGRGKRN
jgi:2-C-methyl-D-erythritol 4-phosphate cytidylyltransferase